MPLSLTPAYLAFKCSKFSVIWASLQSGLQGDVWMTTKALVLPNTANFALQPAMTYLSDSQAIPDSRYVQYLLGMNIQIIPQSDENILASQIAA